MWPIGASPARARGAATPIAVTLAAATRMVDRKIAQRCIFASFAPFLGGDLRMIAHALRRRGGAGPGFGGCGFSPILGLSERYEAPPDADKPRRRDRHGHARPRRQQRRCIPLLAPSG